MKAPTREILQAITYLKGNKNFEVVADWIRESAVHHAEVSCLLEGELSHKEQGKHLALVELKSIIMGAEEREKTLSQKTVSQGAALS